jgi:hypothetical protein
MAAPEQSVTKLEAFLERVGLRFGSAVREN